MEEVSRQANILLIADKDEFLKGQRIAGVDVAVDEADSFENAGFSSGRPVLFDYRSPVKGQFSDARATAEGGRYSLDTMQMALDMALDGRADAICFAPLNKAAMHLSGMTESDEMHWCAGRIGYDGYFCELNVLKELWTARVTSHVALKDVSSLITEERVIASVELVHHSLRRAAIEKPRIGVAALNPHGGDGGNFGREEIDIIAPAVDRVRGKGVQVDGPFPADTIFLRGLAGEYDAIVTMFHDQGQIAMKLTGFDRGVTVFGGIPIPIATPAHGTAFDIMGKGTANVSAMRHAFDLACRMGLQRRQETA
ncbi:MAG: 4-hydroxythreonine-4-phosphate dehydrogenase PdxA [Desulfobacterales bacterium]|nr:MAG: 4-hydroxythreonine-4-phosphate dehydrogenase PdxA [Desulfobacterales bacterium]